MDSKIYYEETKHWKYRLARIFEIDFAYLEKRGIDTQRLKDTYSMPAVRDLLASCFLRVAKGIGDAFYLNAIPGFSYNGASGPTIDTKNSMRGSVVHDILYQLIELGLIPESSRLAADAILEEVCIQDGMSKIRAGIWERAVRRFGGIVIKYFPAGKPKIIEAP